MKLPGSLLLLSWDGWGALPDSCRQVNCVILQSSPPQRLLFAFFWAVCDILNAFVKGSLQWCLGFDSRGSLHAWSGDRGMLFYMEDKQSCDAWWAAGFGVGLGCWALFFISASFELFPCAARTCSSFNPRSVPAMWVSRSYPPCLLFVLFAVLLTFTQCTYLLQVLMVW